MWQLGSPNNPKRKLLLGISLLGTTSNAGASFNAGITVTQPMSGRSVKESNLVSDTLVSLASGGLKTVYASGSSAVNVVNGGSGLKTSVIGFGSVVVVSEQAAGNKQGNSSLSNLVQIFPYFDAASAVVNSFNNSTVVSAQFAGMKAIPSTLVNAVQVALNIAGSKASQSVLVHQVVIAPTVIGARTSSNIFTDAMTVAGSYSGYKLGSGNVAATVTVQASASGTKYINSTAYDVVLTYGQVLGVKPVSGGSVDVVQTLGTGSVGVKQGTGNSQANLEVQANLTWHKQSSGSLLALTLSNQFGSGYKVSRASVNKIVIVNAYGEGKAYFKITLACLHSEHYVVTTLVPKYLVHTALSPVAISATILTTKCVTLAVSHSSNIGKQITLTSRILACQKKCY